MVDHTPICEVITAYFVHCYNFGWITPKFAGQSQQDGANIET